jgi:hypothetical protein
VLKQIEYNKKRREKEERQRVEEEGDGNDGE